MAQIITIFCEGPHDVGFIYRMLKSITYKSYESCRIGDLPDPFNNFITKEVEKSDIANINLNQVRRALLPARVLKKDDKYIFLYSLEGDSNLQARQKMLSDILSFIPEPGEIRRIPKGTSFSVIYLFDSDTKGVLNRLNTINQEVNTILDTKGTINFTKNASIQTVSKIDFGAYIFTGPDNNTGDLESILLPLMKSGNEKIFNEAENFIKIYHDPTRLFPLKIKPHPKSSLAIEKRSTKSKDKFKFYPTKSIIGVAGQLQCSGKSNVVCITDSDYITLDKMRKNPKCIEIIDFLNKI